MDKNLILKRIRQLMKEKGISTYKLKESADISSTIYQWKKNVARDKNRVPSLRSIEKICDYFDVSLAYFFTFDDDEQRLQKNKEVYSNIEKLSDEQIVIIEDIINEFKKNSKDKQR